MPKNTVPREINPVRSVAFENTQTRLEGMNPEVDAALARKKAAGEARLLEIEDQRKLSRARDVIQSAVLPPSMRSDSAETDAAWQAYENYNKLGDPDSPIAVVAGQPGVPGAGQQGGGGLGGSFGTSGPISKSGVYGAAAAIGKAEKQYAAAGAQYGKDVAVTGLQQKQAAQMEADAERTRLKRELDIRSSAEAASQTHIQEQQRLQRYKKNIVGQKNLEIDDMVKRYEAAEPDPNRMFKDGSNILKAGLAVFLGSLGQSLTGGRENLGLRAVEQAIQRDIMAQKMQIEKLGKNIDVKTNMLANFIKTTDSDIAGEAAMEAMLWKQAGRALDKAAAEKGIDAADAGLLQKKAMIDEKVNESVFKTRAEVAKNAEVSAAQRGQLYATAESQRIAATAQRLSAMQKQQEAQGELIPGLVLIGQKPDKASINKARELFGYYGAAREQINRIIQLRQENGWQPITAADVTQSQAVETFGHMLANLKELYGFGAALSDSEKELIARGNPAEIGQALATLTTKLKNVDLFAFKRLRAMGFSNPQLYQYGSNYGRRSVGNSPQSRKQMMGK